MKITLEKYINRYIAACFKLVALFTIISFAGCESEDFDMTVKGEALGDFSISAPVNYTKLTLNSAYPNQTVVITWSAAKPGVNTAPKYTWVATTPDGDITKPVLSIPADNNGLDTKLTLTYKQIDDALKTINVQPLQTSELIWTVIAENGDVKVTSGSTFNISITRMGDVGLNNFTVYGPLSSTTPVVLEEGIGASVKFIWQKSKPTNASDVVYKVVLTKDGETTPLTSFTSDNGGKDTTFTISHENLDKALADLGYPQSSTVPLQWKVIASSSGFDLNSEYANQLYVTRFGKPTKLFVVGGSTVADWNPDNAVNLISNGDGKFDGYQYITVDGFGFKLLPQMNSWNGDIGLKKGSTTELVNDNEDNLSVSSDGFYRIEPVMESKKEGTIKLTKTVWGIVGDATGSWDNSKEMAFNPVKGNYTWTITTYLAKGEMKFRANNAWDINLGGNLNNLTYGGGNFKIDEAGNYTITLNLAPTGYTATIVKN